MDPDLLLAIALTQPLTMEEPKKEYIDEKLFEKILSLSNENVSTFENEEVNKILNWFSRLEKSKISNEQLINWTHFAETFSNILSSLDYSSISSGIFNRMELISQNLLFFSLTQLEISNQFQSESKTFTVSDLRASLLRIIQTLCGAKRKEKDNSLSLSSLSKDKLKAKNLWLPPPLVESEQVSKPSKTSLTVSLANQRFLRSIPNTPNYYQDIYQKTPSNEFLRNNMEFFLKQLEGSQRLFELCTSQILKRGNLNNKSELDNLEEALPFILNTIQFLNSSNLEIIIDLNVIPKVLDLTWSLLQISDIEQTLKLKKIIPTTIISQKSQIFEEILNFFCYQLHLNNTNLCTNLELLIATNLFNQFKYLNDYKNILIIPEECLHVWESITKDTFLCAINFFQSLFSISPNEMKTVNLDQYIPTYYLSPGLEFNFLASYNYSQLINLLLKALTPSLLDTLFFTLYVSFVNSAKQLTAQKQKIIEPSEPFNQDLEDDFGFSHLFTDKIIEDPVQESLLVEANNSVEFSRTLIQFLVNSIFKSTDPAIESFVRGSFSNFHLDVILFICRYQSPKISPVFLEAKSPIINDEDFRNYFHLLQYHLIVNNYVTSEKQVYLIEKIGINKLNLSLFYPQEILIFLSRLLLNQLQSNINQFTETAISIWKGFLNSIEWIIKENKNNDQISVESEYINVEYLYFLLFLFYNLSNEYKVQIVRECFLILSKISNSEYSKIILLYISRLVLLSNFIYQNFVEFPIEIEDLLEKTLFSRSLNNLKAIPHQALFNLTPRETIPRLYYQFPSVKALVSKFSSDNFYLSIYSSFVNKLNICATKYDALTSDYYFFLYWDFLSFLYPPKDYFQFLSSFSSDLAFSNVTLHHIRWIIWLAFPSNLPYFARDWQIPSIPCFAFSKYFFSLLEESLLHINKREQGIRLNAIVDCCCYFFENIFSIQNLERKDLEKELQAFLMDSSFQTSFFSLLVRLLSSYSELYKNQILTFVSNSSDADSSLRSLANLLLQTSNNLSHLKMLGFNLLNMTEIEYEKTSYERNDLDKISQKVFFHGFSSSDNFLGSFKSILSSLLKLTKLTISAFQKYQINIPNVSSIRDVLLNLNLDSSMNYIKADTNFVLSLLGTETELKSLRDLKKLSNIHNFFEQASQLSREPKYNKMNLETLIIEHLSFLIDMKKDPERSKILDTYYLESEFNGSSNVLFRLSLFNQNEEINSKILNLVQSLLKDSPQIKTLILNKLFSEDSLSKLWCEHKLLGFENDSGKFPPTTTIKTSVFDLLENIANSEESYGQIILQKLLNVTETAFFNWEDTSTFFSILQKLAIRFNQLSELIVVITKLFSLNGENVSKNPKSLNLLLNFLIAVLKEFQKSSSEVDEKESNNISEREKGTEVEKGKEKMETPEKNKYMDIEKEGPKEPFKKKFPKLKEKKKEMKKLESNNMDHTEKEETIPELHLKFDFMDTIPDEEEEEDYEQEEEDDEEEDKEDEEEEDEEDDLLEEMDLDLGLPSLDLESCTYNTTQKNYAEQHWYYCYTCGLTLSEGCCSVCARVCHSGHDVSYSRYSRFFCDCGAGGVRGIICKALKGRSKSDINSIPPVTVASVLASLKSSLLTNEPTGQEQNFVLPKLSPSLKTSLANQLKNESLVLAILHLFESLLHLTKEKLIQVPSSLPDSEDIGSSEKSFTCVNNLFENVQSFKNNIFNPRFKFAGKSGRELKSLLNSQSIVRQAIAINSKSKIALVEGDSSITIIDPIRMFESGGNPILDKRSFRILCKASMPYEVVGISFNPAYESYLLAYGCKECRILTLNGKMEVTDHLEINLALEAVDDQSFIVKCMWIPGSLTNVAVITNHCVKIYDLSKDNICPTHNFSISIDQSIKDATIFADSGLVTLIVMCNSGLLYIQSLEFSFSNLSNGPQFLETLLRTPDEFSELQGESIFYSSQRKLLYLSYKQDKTFVAQLDKTKCTLVKVISLVDTSSLSTLPTSFCYMTEVGEFPDNTMIGIGRKGNSSLVSAINVKKNEVQYQSFKIFKSFSKLESVATWNHSVKGPSIAVLLEDGAIFLYSATYVTSSSVQGKTVQEDESPDIPELIKNRDKNLKFPVTFFENVENITINITLAGDILNTYSSDVAKQKLASQDEYIVLSTPNKSKSDTFKLVIKNSNPDMVIVGVRFLVGSYSQENIPPSFELFGRTIETLPSSRRWYDIPFSPLESLLADKEFTVSIPSVLPNGNEPIIDSLEVYAQSKEDFGWKEIMDDIKAVTKKQRERRGNLGDLLQSGLVKLLKVITMYFSVFEPKEPSETISTVLKIIPPLLNEHMILAYLRRPAKDLLLILKQNQPAYHLLKDSTELTFIGQKLSEPTICETDDFIRFVKILSKVAKHRPNNFSRFLTQFPNSPKQLSEIFWIKVNRLVNINSILSSLIEILVSNTQFYVKTSNNDIQDETQLENSFSLLSKFLFSSNEFIRSSSSQKLSSIISSFVGSKSNISISSATNTTSHDNSNSTTSPSSIQFYCDFCHAFPIIGKRFTCTICKDFDLCENCYKSSKTFSGEHSSDHPMNEQIIEEQKSLSEEIDGTSSLVPFGLELEDEGIMMQLAVETSLGYENDQPLPTQHLINNSSTSKLSFQKELLSFLLNRFSIAQTEGGKNGIAYMQVLLALMKNGTENKALGEHVVSSIEFLINTILSKNPNVQKRTHELETALLFFMALFHLLQSKDGSSTKSSSLSLFVEEVISKLKNIGFITFLYSALSQLLEKLETGTMSTLHTTQQVGALLSPKQQDLDSTAFLPFFSETYVKQNSLDLFSDFYILEIETFFKVAYALNHSANKFSTKDFSTKKSVPIFEGEKWIPLLCKFIATPSTFIVRDYAKKLLLSITKSKLDYYKLRDNSVLNFRLQTLFSVSAENIENLTYDQTVKLTDSLSAILKVASTRPWNWQVFCQENQQVLPHLIQLALVIPQEQHDVLSLLKLLTLAFVSKESIETEEEKEQPKGKDKEKEEEKKGEKTEKKDQDQLDRLAFKSKIVRSPFKFREQEDSPERDDKPYYVSSSNHILDRILKRRPMEIPSPSPSSAKISLPPISLPKKKKTWPASLLPNQLYQQFLPLLSNNKAVLSRFVNALLLEINQAEVRQEVAKFLKGFWSYLKKEQHCTLLSIITSKFSCAPIYGRNAAEFMDLVGYFMAEVSKEGTREIENLITIIADTMKQQNLFLATHPNSQLYRSLQKYVEFDGYYLESKPCLVCNDPEQPWFIARLDNLKLETKFTDSTQVIKFNNSYLIQSISLIISDVKKAKMLSGLNIYYNNKPNADIGELKNNWNLWKKAKSVHLSPNQTQLTAEFSIPVSASNLLIEYASFHENLQAQSMEKLQCPRCSSFVTDKHGVCPRCRENAFQCRQCRNINYENPQAFLCNECGFCKWGKFDYSLTIKPNYGVDKIESEEDYKKAIATIDKEAENAHNKFKKLQQLKEPLTKTLLALQGTSKSIPEEELDLQSISSSIKVNKNVAILAQIYEKDCKNYFDSLSKYTQVILATRKELANYTKTKQKVNDWSGTSSNRESNYCYGCVNEFIGYNLNLIEKLSQFALIRTQLVQKGIIEELIHNNLNQGSVKYKSEADVRKIICLLTKDSKEATSLLNLIIRERLKYALLNYRSLDLAEFSCNYIQLMAESCKLEDSIWEDRIKFLIEIFFSVIEYGYQNPVIADNILVPCYSIIVNLCHIPSLPIRSSKEKLQTQPKQSTNEVDAMEIETKNDKISPKKIINMNSNPTISYKGWLNGEISFETWKNRYEHFILQDQNQTSNQLSNTELREYYLQMKYARKWKLKVQKRLEAKRKIKTSDPANNEGFWKIISDSAWIKKLLVAPSLQLRHYTVDLIKAFCTTSNTRVYLFLDLLIGLINEMNTKIPEERLIEALQLFKELIEPEEVKLYLAARHFLNSLCNFCLRQIEKIRYLENEYSFTTELTLGEILSRLLEILTSFIEVNTIRAKFKRDNLMEQVLEGFLGLRSVILQKTKLVDNSLKLLSELLNKLKSDSEEDNKSFMKACIVALRKQNIDERTQTFIFEQLCNIVCPIKPEPVYHLIMQKSPTQEEFIRGNLSAQPYSTIDIGRLMRDVKNKICTTLDLRGLLEDDNSMELLVCNKIIKLDLPIRQVYENVWKRALIQRQEESSGEFVLSRDRDFGPMIVVYRLQGLDGEATEEIVDSLADNNEEEQDPEEEFKISNVLHEYQGFEEILKIIHGFEDFKRQHSLASLVLRLLTNSSKVKANRRTLLELGAIPTLLRSLKLAFAAESFTDLAEMMLITIESLLLEANTMKDKELSSSSESFVGISVENGIIQMKMFLEKISSPLITGNPKIGKTVSRILPYLTYGQEKIIEILVNYFEPHLNFEQYDQYQDKEQKLLLECFSNVCESIRVDDNGAKLKEYILVRGVTKNLIDYISTHFVSFQEQDIESEEFQKTLTKESLPFVLRQIGGLANGHILTQQLIFESSLISILHVLEKCTTTNKIGNLAENILEALREGEEKIRLAVDNIREKTRNKKAEKAAKYREKILKELHLQQNENSNKVTLETVPDIIEELEEEKGLQCMVCKEGYSFRPDQVLGVYTFSKRITLPTVPTIKHRREMGFTTVTHFNIIHIQCHTEATKAEKQMRPPKDEWQGATIRNNHTKCNNLFPLIGPNTPSTSYTSALDKYWLNMNNIQRIDSSSRFRLLVHDFKFLLRYFAKEESFSIHSQGGGKESNIKLIPCFMQMALYFADEKGAIQRKIYEKALTQFLAQPVTESEIAIDDVFFMLILSLLFHNLTEWKEAKPIFLKRVLTLAFLEELNKLAPNTSQESPFVTTLASLKDEKRVFEVTRPGLIFLFLVDQLHQMYKSSKVSNESTIPHKPEEEEWIIEMKKLILDDLTLSRAEKTNELLRSYEEELTKFESVGEFFDQLNLLNVVLKEAKSEIEFIQNIFQNIKL